MTTTSGPRPVRAARGTTLTAQGWQQEAALRMLMNNLDPEVAEHPDELVVYGGTGKAARNWACFDAMVRTLTTLKDDETMLVQSGKPVGVFRTHEWAPRVLLANSNLVGDWATWPEFRRLEHLGLTMYGQMTAGSWIYIGTQGILQGTYETFAAVAAKRFGGTLAGTLTRDRRLRRHGRRAAARRDDERGHLPDDRRRPDAPAPTRRDALPRRDRRRPRRRDRPASPRTRRSARPSPSGSSATPRRSCPSCCAAGSPIDIVTDQTSAHDPLYYIPEGIDFDDARDYADRKPEEFTERAQASMAKHVEAMVGFMDGGAEVFDYGNSIRDEARKGGYDRAFAFPGFIPAYIRPLFCEGKGPFRWVALSGDPKDIAPHRPGRARPLPGQRPPAPLDHDGPGPRRLPGPARPHLLARLRRAGQGRARVQRPRRQRRGERPDRHRPRPPRLRLGGLALPGDRGDARRLRRDRRLAAAERDAQHLVRARRGCRSTTAAASASAGRSTPARSAWPTARRSPPRSSSAC